MDAECALLIKSRKHPLTTVRDCKTGLTSKTGEQNQPVFGLKFDVQICANQKLVRPASLMV
jgi:hypothetical protein